MVETFFDSGVRATTFHLSFFFFFISYQIESVKSCFLSSHNTLFSSLARMHINIHINQILDCSYPDLILKTQTTRTPIIIFFFFFSYNSPMWSTIKIYKKKDTMYNQKHTSIVCLYKWERDKIKFISQKKKKKRLTVLVIKLRLLRQVHTRIRQKFLPWNLHWIYISSSVFLSLSALWLIV